MNFLVTGTVINGNKIGRRIGFPTANVKIDPQAEIPNGVYTAQVTLDGQQYDAVVNVGYKPTLGQSQSRILEAHIFDFSDDIYGKTIRLELKKFIRAEVRFSSLEELRQQIEKDKTEALETLRPAQEQTQK